MDGQPVQTLLLCAHMDEIGLVIGDLRQRVETVLGEDDLAAGLHEKYLSAAPDGIAVIDDHHAYAREVL